MKIKMLKTTFVKGDLAEKGSIVETDQKDGEYLVGMGSAIASSEEVKKPENKAVKKKSIFSRKKK